MPRGNVRDRHIRARHYRASFDHQSPDDFADSLVQQMKIDILYFICIVLTAIYVFILLTTMMSAPAQSPPVSPQADQHNTKTLKSAISTIPQSQIGLTHHPVNDIDGGQEQCLYTYMQLTDGTFDYLYGILAIHGALIRAKSRYSHNIMLMPDVPQSQIDLFHHLGIGMYHIDGGQMDPFLTECDHCWTVTFYKLFIFNMTSFDKILYLDTDVGIMHYAGIDEVFAHPTPSAVSDRGGNHFELNGGVLLVEPDRKLFHQLLAFMPRVRNAKQLEEEAKAQGIPPPVMDNWNSEYRDNCGDQGFINAFFNSNETGYGPFYALHYRYGLLTSSFSNEWQRYLLQHRPYILKNVHFTVYKPWHQDGRNRFRQITSNIGKHAGRGQQAGYQDELLNRFFVRYWMDIQIALQKCGDYCKRHFPQFEIPDDVDKFLKVRPEPFTCFEEQVEFVSDADFKTRYDGKTCPD